MKKNNQNRTLPQAFFDEWDRPKQVDYIVTAILEEKKAFSSVKSVPGGDIWSQANKEFKELEFQTVRFRPPCPVWSVPIHPK